jgi:transcriptional regulator with XRE-family HTH domain
LSEQVAEEIRVMMTRRRMSGRQLAQRLNVSPAWVSYRLTGTQPIDLNDLQQIADVLEVAVGDLLPAGALQRRPQPLPGTQTTEP